MATHSPPTSACSSLSGTEGSIGKSTSNFLGLYQLFTKSKAPEHPQHAVAAISTPTPPLLEDVDHVLRSTESPEQARDLLRGMVADLLRENDSLKQELKCTRDEVTAATADRDLVLNEYKQRLITLNKTVERAVGGSCGFELSPRSGSVLSPGEATELVIQSLSNKVEQLNVDNQVLLEDLRTTRERMEDLQSQNEATVYKISALEAQFQTINKTRQTYVEKSVVNTTRRQTRPSTDSPDSSLPKKRLQQRTSPVSVMAFEAISSTPNDATDLTAPPLDPPATTGQPKTSVKSSPFDPTQMYHNKLFEPMAENSHLATSSSSSPTKTASPVTRSNSPMVKPAVRPLIETPQSSTTPMVKISKILSLATTNNNKQVPKLASPPATKNIKSSKQLLLASKTATPASSKLVALRCRSKPPDEGASSPPVGRKVELGPDMGEI
jgi:hypothetical protein